MKKLKNFPLLLSFLLISFFCNYYIFSHEETPHETSELLLLSNQTGDNLQKNLLQAISKAKESITLIIYTLTDDSIITLLKEKADAGVQVSLIVDLKANEELEWKVKKSPINLHLVRKRGLMHQKFLVIDHKTVCFGSTNCTKESFFLHANLLLTIQNEQLAAQIEKKATLLKQKKGKEKIPPFSLYTKEQKLELFFSPDHGKAALEKILSLINSAEKSIYVAMYTFTHKELGDALLKAHQRGVNVQCVLDFEQAKHTSRQIFLSLKKQAFPVFLSKRRGLLHHKLMLVDETTLVTGSTNWTKGGFFFNDDALFVISHLTETQKTKILSIWNIIKKESKSSYSK